MVHQVILSTPGIVSLRIGFIFQTTNTRALLHFSLFSKYQETKINRVYWSRWKEANRDARKGKKKGGGGLSPVVFEGLATEPGRRKSARSNLSFSSAVRRERAEWKESPSRIKTQVNNCCREAAAGSRRVKQTRWRSHPHTDHSAMEAAGGALKAKQRQVLNMRRGKENLHQNRLLVFVTRSSQTTGGTRFRRGETASAFFQSHFCFFTLLWGARVHLLLIKCEMHKKTFQNRRYMLIPMPVSSIGTDTGAMLTC